MHSENSQCISRPVPESISQTFSCDTHEQVIKQQEVATVDEANNNEHEQRTQSSQNSVVVSSQRRNIPLGIGMLCMIRLGCRAMCILAKVACKWHEVKWHCVA